MLYPGRARRRARARSLRGPAGRGAARVPLRGQALWIEMAAPRPRVDGSDTFFLGSPPETPARAARRPGSEEPQSLPAERRRDRSRPPEARAGDGRADGVREHGDGRPRLQRDRGEDARRPAAGRPAAHDVHGRLPAGSVRQPARPSVRGVVLHARRRGRRRRRRRSLHASAGRRLLDGGRMRPCLLRDAGAAPCAGSRRRRPGRRRATRTATSATGTTSSSVCRPKRAPRSREPRQRPAGDGRARRPRPVPRTSTGGCSSSAASRISSSRSSSRARSTGRRTCTPGRRRSPPVSRASSRSATASLRPTAGTGTRSPSASIRRSCSTRCSAVRPASTVAGPAR